MCNRRTNMSKEIKISGAEAVIRCLLEEGVDLIYGYPGGAIMPVYDELFKFQDKIIHLSGNKQFSYYEFCIKFIQYFGHDLKLIKPTTSDKNVLFNPKYCTLKSNNLTDINNPLNVEDLFLSL